MTETAIKHSDESAIDRDPAERVAALQVRIAQKNPDMTDQDRVAIARLWLGGSAIGSGDDATATAQREDPGWIDIVAIARERQDVRADLLAERLERAVDTVVECRLTGQVHDRAAVRAILFELDEQEILTKADVRRRGALEPEEFYEELRAYRLRSTAS